MRTVVALFDRFEDAQQAVQALHDIGYDRNDINMIARDVNGDYTRYLDESREGDTQDVSDGAAAGAGAGAILGGLGGLLVGLGALAIPGIGPVLAAGPIVTALAGAGVGALAGGLIGALVDLGIPEDHANMYAEGVRRGGTLVVVRSQDAQAEQARSILNRFNPVDIENRSEGWRDNRWTGFDQQGHELTADQMEFNRSSAPMPVTGADVDHNVNRDLTLDQASSTPSQEVQNRHLDTSNMDQDTGHYNPGDIPAADRPLRHDDDLDHMDDQFDSGMNQHLTEDVYSSERSHEEVVDIPVTGARLDTNEMIGRENIEANQVEEGNAVEDLGTNTNPMDWDRYNKAFQYDFMTRFPNTGFGYDYYQPAYRYGYDLASNPMYEGYDWASLEPVARQDWERRGISGAWDDVKDAVRHAWEAVTNR